MNQVKTIQIRHGNERGHTKISWLDSYHTFSFGGYVDPNHMGFRSLRVINDDRVAPGAGFATHSHRDMEIITYVLEGALEHRDSLGTGAVIYPGDAQRMSAGSGITHSEFNHSKTKPVHFLQIWIVPDRKGLSPSYEQRTFPSEERSGILRLIAAKDGREGAVTIHQDVDLYASLLQPNDLVSYHLKPQRYAWVQVARGVVTLNGHSLKEGDGAAVNGEEQLEISTDTGGEILLFDLA
ncbi:quercetin 2,3-dioxygenase [Fischerella thermalis CCMEE 5282]|uniref:pirin family protein n=1 Tax=Fischerella thermalis TaxID=372787 RepID=UPI000C8078B3|nr:pirin family protein [Fischerella thermalis]PMB12958.1 quercetin 2,3-dioxygenase [Fischerella thermalis CCMEE 5328]PMB14216.1 quercetin 2,3-dioxygenase [Fischerella thermalis CCMEE 5282]